MKLRQRIAGSRCGTTVPGAKTKQETTRENDLGRIGKDEVGGSNPPSSSRKSSLFFWKGWIFLVFQHFSRCFGFLNLDLTTQTATDREKRLTERISHSVSRRFLSACFQTLFFSGNFRFHFCYHRCQQLFTLFLTVSVDIPRALFAVGPDGRVASFPELLVDLGDAPGPRLTPLAFMGLECTGSGLS